MSTKKDDVVGLGICIGIIIGAVALGLLSWKTERWINWKLSYGSKVDNRIEQLDERITVLETRLDNLD